MSDVPRLPEASPAPSGESTSPEGAPSPERVLHPARHGSRFSSAVLCSYHSQAQAATPLQIRMTPNWLLCRRGPLPGLRDAECRQATPSRAVSLHALEPTNCFHTAASAACLPGASPTSAGGSGLVGSISRSVRVMSKELPAPGVPEGSREKNPGDRSPGLSGGQHHPPALVTPGSHRGRRGTSRRRTMVAALQGPSPWAARSVPREHPIRGLIPADRRGASSGH